MTAARQAILLALGPHFESDVAGALEGASYAVSVISTETIAGIEDERELAELLKADPEALVAGDGIFPRTLDQDRALEAGLRRLFIACKCVTRSMMRRRFGRVVAIAPESAAGFVPSAAALGSVGGLMKSIAREVGTRGITANVIAPGRVDGSGDMSRYVAVGRLAQPRDISSVVGFLVGDSSAYITGQILAVDGGLTTA